MLPRFSRIHLFKSEKPDVRDGPYRRVCKYCASLSIRLGNSSQVRRACSHDITKTGLSTPVIHYLPHELGSAELRGSP